MTVIAIIPAVVCIAGALVYLLSSKPEVKQLAIYAYACGLLVTLFTLANHVIRIG